jgi:hypothetical protein
MTTHTPELASLVRDFVYRLVAAVETDAIQRIQDAVSAAFVVSAVSAKPVPLEPGQSAAANAKPRRRLNLSPTALATRKLQGKYMGVIRPLPPALRERVKKVAREQGVAEAIKFAASAK